MLKPPGHATSAPQWLWSFYAAALVTVAFCLYDPSILHWCLIPITVSGGLIGADATRLFSDRGSLFRPSVVVAIFGIHFFFIAPLLHLVWDYWPRWVIPPEDWRTALGWLSSLHVLGLIIYRFVLSKQYLPTSFRPIRRKSFTSILGMMALISGITFIALVALQGGPSAYLRLVSEERERLDGFGWIFLIAESWPLLAFIYVLVKYPRLRSSAASLIIALTLVIVIQFFVGGLRGSRSNLVWPALIAFAFAHVYVRRIPRRLLLVGVIALMPFMYLYGIYKGGGVEAVGALRAGVSAEVLADETGRGYDLVLLEDFGRAGTQAAVLDGVARDRGLGVVWGLGYVGDILKLLPDAAVPFDTPDKVELGTAALYGTSVLEGEWRSSRIYGLTGEALLNFGVLGAIAVYAVFGSAVKRLDGSYLVALQAPRLLTSHFTVPLGVVALILVLGSDLDNVLWFLAKQGGLLLVALALSLEKPQALEVGVPRARRDAVGLSKGREK